MDAFDESFSELLGGCLVALATAVVAIGVLVLIASHIQWK